MANIQISSQEVFQYSAQLKGMNTQVQQIFEEIKNKVQQLESVWQSPTANKLMEQFHSLDPVFRSYVQSLDQYAQYLQQTAQAYQENEQMLLQGVQV